MDGGGGGSVLAMMVAAGKAVAQELAVGGWRKRLAEMVASESV